MSEGIDVRVENRLIRFIPAKPVDQGRVEADLGGVRAGELVVVALTRPSATVIVDREGRLIVHGTHRVEAAQAAAKEILLRLGVDDVRSEPCLPVTQQVDAFLCEVGGSCRYQV